TALRSGRGTATDSKESRLQSTLFSRRRAEAPGGLRVRSGAVLAFSRSGSRRIALAPQLRWELPAPWFGFQTQRRRGQVGMVFVCEAVDQVAAAAPLSLAHDDQGRHPIGVAVQEVRECLTLDAPRSAELTLDYLEGPQSHDLRGLETDTVG